jgi:hypothetical protein
MTHLSPQEFVDAIDGTLAAARQAHVDACAACRDDVAALTGTLAETRGADPVVEPSPLFWDHFARRVHEATAAEPVVSRWWSRWQPMAALAAAAAVVIVAVVARPRAPIPSETSAVVSVADNAAAEFQLLEASDEPVAVMSALAGEMSWEEVQAINLAPSRAAVDLAVVQLTDAQKQELIRIVRQEIRGGE